MRHYCTYFDHRYLSRGLAMIRSLRQFEPEAQIWVLALSKQCEEVLGQLAEPGVIPIGLQTLEQSDPELAATKSNRSIIEYYFTCTASLIWHVLGQVGNEDLVTYIDGDLYFYSSPDPLYTELGSDDVSIIPHRFTPAMEHMLIHGIYNVGWLTFRTSDTAKAVCSWWRERCIEWCFDRLEGDRFADQKYLDRFLDFPGVKVLEHPGANLAPWNIGGHQVSFSDDIKVDGQPLIFFHFHAIRKLGEHYYSLPHRGYKAPMTWQMRQRLYKPYLHHVLQIESDIVEKLLPPEVRTTSNLNRLPDARPGILTSLRRTAGKWVRMAAQVMTLNFVLVLNRRIY